MPKGQAVLRKAPVKTLPEQTFTAAAQEFATQPDPEQGKTGKAMLKVLFARAFPAVP